MTEKVLYAKNLSRIYGSFQALKPIDLSLEAGDLVSLVGPNGSGKSTLLTCLGGLLKPTTGEVFVEGFNLYEKERQVRERLAYVPDVPVFYPELTAWEHIQFIAQAHHVKSSFEQRAKTVMSEFGLWEARNLFPHAFSRGMRLKLGLALALIRPSCVLLLDEPFSSLDQESSRTLIRVLVEKASTGSAILFSTHILPFSELLGAKTWHIHDGILAF